MSALDKRLTSDIRLIHQDSPDADDRVQVNLCWRLEICPPLAVFWLRMDGTLRQRLAREFVESRPIRQVFEGYFSQEDKMTADEKNTQAGAGDVHIWRDKAGIVHAKVNGRPLRHVVHHSPTGFEVGYGGSGPADLALSILHDHLERAGYNGKHVGVFGGMCLHAAYALHQDFKWEHVATLDRNAREWIIRRETITAFVEAHKDMLVVYARRDAEARSE